MSEAHKAIVEYVNQRFNPRSIVLFGSRARGDNRSDSDWDVLVVLAIKGTREEIWSASLPIVGWTSLLEGGYVSFTVRGVCEVESQSHSDYMKNIVQDGITLYGDDLKTYNLPFKLS